jgi:hypothetical protein
LGILPLNGYEGAYNSSYLVAVVVIYYGALASPRLAGEKPSGQLSHVFLLERRGVPEVAAKTYDLLVGVRGVIGYFYHSS